MPSCSILCVGLSFGSGPPAFAVVPHPCADPVSVQQIHDHLGLAQRRICTHLTRLSKHRKLQNFQMPESHPFTTYPCTCDGPTNGAPFDTATASQTATLGPPPEVPTREPPSERLTDRPCQRMLSEEGRSVDALAIRFTSKKHAGTAQSKQSKHAGTSERPDMTSGPRGVLATHQLNMNLWKRRSSPSS